MADPIYEQYADDIRREEQYRVVWPPGRSIELGDVGELVDGIFNYRGKLAKPPFGITFEHNEDPSPDERWTHQSSSGVEVSFKGKGEVGQVFAHLAKAEAGFRVAYSRSGAVVVALHNVTINSILDHTTLKKDLLQLYRTDLDKRYIVVTELVQAESGTVLISNSSNSEIEIKAAADIGKKLVELGNAELGLSTKYTRGIAEEVVGTAVTPFYKAFKLKNRWIRADVIETVRGDGDFDEFIEEVPLAPVPPPPTD